VLDGISSPYHHLLKSRKSGWAEILYLPYKPVIDSYSFSRCTILCILWWCLALTTTIDVEVIIKPSGRYYSHRLLNNSAKPTAGGLRNAANSYESLSFLFFLSPFYENWYPSTISRFMSVVKVEPSEIPRDLPCAGSSAGKSAVANWYRVGLWTQTEDRRNVGYSVIEIGDMLPGGGALFVHWPRLAHLRCESDGLLQTVLNRPLRRSYSFIHARTNLWMDQMTFMGLILELQRAPLISSSSMNRLLEIALPERIQSDTISSPK